MSTGWCFPCHVSLWVWCVFSVMLLFCHAKYYYCRGESSILLLIKLLLPVCWVIYMTHVQYVMCPLVDLWQAAKRIFFVMLKDCLPHELCFTAAPPELLGYLYDFLNNALLYVDGFILVVQTYYSSSPNCSIFVFRGIRSSWIQM